MVINESELRYEMRDQNNKIETLMKKLKKDLKLNKLILTRGAKGVISLNKQDKFIIVEPFLIEL